jgi:hypothetical protein
MSEPNMRNLTSNDHLYGEEDYMLIPASIIGVISGLIIGVVFVWQGALNAFFVLLFLLAGWLVGRLLMGEIDILDLYERFMQSRGKRRR